MAAIETPQCGNAGNFHTMDSSLSPENYFVKSILQYKVVFTEIFKKLFKPQNHDIFLPRRFVRKIS